MREQKVRAPDRVRQVLVRLAHEGHDQLADDDLGPPRRIHDARDQFRRRRIDIRPHRMKREAFALDDVAINRAGGHHGHVPERAQLEREADVRKQIAVRPPAG